MASTDTGAAAFTPQRTSTEPLTRPPLPDGPFLVLGLRRAGVAAAEALAGRADGADVALWDDSPSVRSRVSGVLGEGYRVVDSDQDLRGIGSVVKSPGIAPEHPLLLEARRLSLPVLDELELGWQLTTAPMLAVTGTNGKSTTVALLADVLGAHGLDASVAGNVESIQGGPLSALTAGSGYVVAEVSSFQAESLVELLPQAAIFTNLTPDHLQRHGTMEAYAEAKRRLFVNGGRAVELGVLNVDDPLGRRLDEEVRARGGRTLTYGSSPGADYRLVSCRSHARGSLIELRTPAGPIALPTGMPGSHNAANVAAVLALADGLGLSRSETLQSLSHTRLLEGRLERVDASQPFEVIVDFAHSPDSIDRVLELLGSIAKENAGRLITVLAMAPTGERLTREACGRIARARADHLLLSAWSIRGEPQLLSLEWVLAGARAAEGGELEVVIQRRAAIARALSLARPGDVVAIIGRGPIKTLALSNKGGVEHFDDREVVRELLRRGA